MLRFPSPDRPIFWKSKKGKLPESLVKKLVLKFTSTRSCLINTNCLKLSSILRFCSLFRHLIVLLVYIFYHLITKKGARNQVFILSSPALTSTQIPSCVHSFFFFCSTDRPNFTRGRAMGKETFYWDGLVVIRALSISTLHSITISRENLWSVVATPCTTETNVKLSQL